MPALELHCLARRTSLASSPIIQRFILRNLTCNYPVINAQVPFGTAVSLPMFTHFPISLHSLPFRKVCHSRLLVDPTTFSAIEQPPEKKLNELPHTHSEIVNHNPRQCLHFNNSNRQDGRAV